MEKKSLDKIMEDFYEEYQEDPRGWNFWVSSPPTSDDFYEAYIIHGDEAFFLKIDSIYTPNPVGVGVELKIERDQLVESLPDFGFRKFDWDETRDLLDNLPKPEGYESKEDFIKDLNEFRIDLVGRAMDMDPMPFESPEDQGGLITLGPYSKENPLSYVSEKQEELKKDLSRKLERIIQRNHPGYY